MRASGGDAPRQFVWNDSVGGCLSFSRGCGHGVDVGSEKLQVARTERVQSSSVTSDETRPRSVTACVTARHS